MRAAVRADGLSPRALLRIYMSFVLVTAIVAISAVILATQRIQHSSDAVLQENQSSLAVVQAQRDLRVSLLLLLSTADDYLNSSAAPQATALRTAFLENLLSPSSAQASASSLPSSLQIPISERDAFALQGALASVSQSIDKVVAGSSGTWTASLLSGRDALGKAFSDYVNTNSATSFRDTLVGIATLGDRLDQAAGSLASSLSTDNQSASSAVSTGRLLMLGPLVVLALTIVAATLLVTRVIQDAFASGEAEREVLRQISNTLKQRNNQLAALYSVFTEITDTLSLPYVVSTTLREARKLMNSDMVVLRILRDSELVVAGAQRADGTPIEILPPVKLGEGPTGRAAKRGRTLRLDSDAQSLMNTAPTASGQAAPSPNGTWMESGLIVPLIVGARVVGTLACWSKKQNAFTEEDERILEMMSSQVATAVIAAETTDTSERRALQDPLTGLPNRRQLSQDIAGEFTDWLIQGRHAVVAMVDIDHFKRLNDDFGHRVGDVTLQKVASVMRYSIRDSDRIYRYGGEEFVVIFADAGRETGLMLTERLLRAVADTPLSGDQLEPVGPVTISAGLALWPEQGRDFNELIELADRAMYRAKESGRNRVVIWEANMSPSGLAPAV